jgi:pilus assembly protein CpaE
MLTLLRSMFDFVVIDAGHSLSDLGQQAALASDTVFVVSQLSLPYLANTNKVLGTLKQLLPAPEKRLRVIVNRHDKKGEVSMHEAESSLQTEIFWSLPADYKFATSAINQGKPLSQVGPRHKLTRSMQDLAAKLSPEAGDKEEKKKWFFR